MGYYKDRFRPRDKSQGEVKFKKAIKTKAKRPSQITRFKKAKVSSSRSAQNPNPISNYKFNGKKIVQKNSQKSYQVFNKLGLKNSQEDREHQLLNSSKFPKKVDKKSSYLQYRASSTIKEENISTRTSKKRLKNGSVLYNSTAFEKNKKKQDTLNKTLNESQNLARDASSTSVFDKFQNEFNEALHSVSQTFQCLLNQEETLAILLKLGFLNLSSERPTSEITLEMDLVEDFFDNFLQENSDLIRAYDLYYILLVVKGQTVSVAKRICSEFDISQRFLNLAKGEILELKRSFRPMLVNRIKQNYSQLRGGRDTMAVGGTKVKRASKSKLSMDLQLYKSISPDSGQNNGEISSLSHKQNILKKLNYLEKNQKDKEVRFVMNKSQRSIKGMNSSLLLSQVQLQQTNKPEKQKEIKDKRKSHKKAGSLNLSSLAGILRSHLERNEKRPTRGNSTHSKKNNKQSFASARLNNYKSYEFNPKSNEKKQNQKGKGILKISSHRHSNSYEASNDPQFNSFVEESNLNSPSNNFNSSKNQLEIVQENVKNIIIADSYSDYNEEYDELMPKKKKKANKNELNQHLTKPKKSAAAQPKRSYRYPGYFDTGAVKKFKNREKSQKSKKGKFRSTRGKIGPSSSHANTNLNMVRSARQDKDNQQKKGLSKMVMSILDKASNNIGKITNLTVQVLEIISQMVSEKF